MTPANPDALADARDLIRQSLKVGAPGLSEAAREAVVRSIMLKLEGKVLAPILADLQRVTAERDEYSEALMKVAEIGGWQASASLYAEVRSRITAAEARAAQLQAEVEAVLDEATRMSSILLMAGEMTARERRAARAVALGISLRVHTALAARAATAREGA